SGSGPRPETIWQRGAGSSASLCRAVSDPHACRSRTHAGAARMPITGTAQVATLASQLAHSPGYPARLAAKGRQLAAAEKQRPLAAYRAAELAIMRRNFSGPGEPYPELRRAFVYKEKPLRTPSHLARHRTHPWPARPGETRAPQMVRV